MKSRLRTVILGVLLVATKAQQSAPPCDDVHTESCIHFHDSRPDLCDDPTFADNMCKRFCGNCPLECYSCTDEVKHPQDCNTTTTCAPDMQCVTRNFVAKDGQREYRMDCESKELCQLLAGSFGRRDISATQEIEGESRDRSEREVVMTCCGTDLCNAGTTTTTTTASPTTTLPAITTAASDCNKDVVFVMQNFVTTIRHHTHGSVSDWIPYVQQIVPHLNVGPGKSRVAVVTFDRHSQMRWYLNNYTTSGEIQSALGQLGTQQVTTDTHIGGNPAAVFNQVSGHVFTPENGDRKAQKNVVVVFEHGAFNGHMTHGDVIPTEVAGLHNVSDNVILVSVKAEPDAHHYGIATDHNHEITVDYYGSLRNIIPQIVQLICA